MKLLRQLMLGVIGLFAFASCNLFGPNKPYNQGDRRDPLVLDRPHPESHPHVQVEACKPIDYLLPWRLISCGR